MLPPFSDSARAVSPHCKLNALSYKAPTKSNAQLTQPNIGLWTLDSYRVVSKQEETEQCYEQVLLACPILARPRFSNAVTAQSSAVIANYAFSTSKPNVGVVTVPDERLAPLAEIVKTKVIVPASVEFLDIAGLVRGSSKGEGLGNQFLASIRESDTMIHVVRCFEDENIVHVDDTIDARRDIETIQIELALADLATVERRRERVQKGAKVGRRLARAELEVLDKLQPRWRSFSRPRVFLLTKKSSSLPAIIPINDEANIYAANVDGATLADTKR